MIPVVGIRYFSLVLQVYMIVAGCDVRARLSGTVRHRMARFGTRVAGSAAGAPVASGAAAVSGSIAAAVIVVCGVDPSDGAHRARRPHGFAGGRLRRFAGQGVQRPRRVRGDRTTGGPAGRADE